jgi:hypothetical protein
MKKSQQLQAKRDQLFREAEALKSPEGTFATDEARAAFDTKTTELEALDVQIREALADEQRQAPTQPAAPAVDAEAIRTATVAAIAAERQRVTDIQTVVRIAKLDAPFAEKLVKDGVSLDAARKAIFDKLAADSEAIKTDQHVTLGEDAKDKWVRGATNALLVRSGLAPIVAKHERVSVESMEPGEFRGLSLRDLARESLERRGFKTRGLSMLTMVGHAFTYRDATQSTSDFAILLENVMHKVLQAQYSTTPDTWSRWCNRSTVSDFRAHVRYRMGLFGGLDALNENGEFKNKPITDAEKASITATTKGNIINISRQVVVNDDLGAVTRLLSMLGRAAALSVEIDAYTLLLLNSGLGPTQSDSQPLFHSNRSNVGTGSALSAAGLDADAVVMGSQKDKDQNEILELRPAVLLVPLSLRGQANVINQSQYDPDNISGASAKATLRPNLVNGMFQEIVGTARLTGTRRYLFANPAAAPVFEVAFLEGEESPVLETQAGWRVDGTEMKVRFDYGVKDVDYRGAVTNAGA